MKKTTRTLGLVAAIIAVSFSLSSFKRSTIAVESSYTIELISKTPSGTGETWTWSVTNPNPGNGSNGTLQDISHWSMPLPAAAEASLLKAEYSYDGVNWFSVNTVVDRDPSIKACTGVDVLKFDVGTTGTQPTYYRISLGTTFNVNTFAFSYIKTGGGQQGCNLYLFSGLGSSNSGLSDSGK